MASYRDDVTLLFEAYLTGLDTGPDDDSYIKKQQRKVVERLIQQDDKYSLNGTVLDYTFQCVNGKSRGHLYKPKHLCFIGFLYVFIGSA